MLLDAELKCRLNAAAAGAIHNRCSLFPTAVGAVLLFIIYLSCSAIVDDCFTNDHQINQCSFIIPNHNVC